MMKIYVKKSVKSLNKIGQPMAKFLKAGRPVIVKYNNADEREIMIRWQKKGEKLYDECTVTPDDYPPTGYVVYTNTELTVYADEPNVDTKIRFTLIYDPFGFKSALNNFADFAEDMAEVFGVEKKKFKSREKW